MPDGGVMDFSYDDEGMRTYTKDADGRVVSYESDDGFRNTRAAGVSGILMTKEGT